MPLAFTPGNLRSKFKVLDGKIPSMAQVSDISAIGEIPSRTIPARLRDGMADE
jgi:hypothetical protein